MSILVVEHKPGVMAIADHIVDMGPGTGKEGGAVGVRRDVRGAEEMGTKTGKHLAQQPVEDAGGKRGIADLLVLKVRDCLSSQNFNGTQRHNRTLYPSAIPPLLWR
jgi:excinuclease UvrABC ATPase subunit